MVSQLMVASGTNVPQTNLGPPSLGLKGVWPINTLLRALFLARLALIDVPFRSLAYILFPRWARQHKNWGFVRCLLVAVLNKQMRFGAWMGLHSNTIDKSVLPRLSAKKKGAAVWIQPVNRQTGLTGEMAEIFAAGACTTTRIPAYWIGDNYDGSKGSRDADPNGEKVVLFFHGGGYKAFNGLPDTSGPFNNLNLLMRAANKSKKQPRKESPRRALSVEYRLTDEVTFPAILADALAAWQYLVRDLHFRPQDIIISGDSAGGNLSLALARYIRDERPLFNELGLAKDEPIADSLVLMSPWCDISMSYIEAGPSSSGQKNAGTDFLDHSSLLSARELLMKGLPMTFATSRWVSPICTQRNMEEDLFDTFPRAFVTFGGCELFVDEIRALSTYYNDAAGRGKAGQLTLHEAPLAPHDYLCLPVGGFKEEHRRVVDALSEWI